MTYVHSIIGTILFILFFIGCNPKNESKFPEDGSASAYTYSIYLDSLNLQYGKEFIEKVDYAEARDYLLESTKSENIPIRTESYLYLNFIETRLQNWDMALIYLEEYHKSAMLLYNRAVQAEKDVHRQKDSLNNIFHLIENQERTKWVTLAVIMIVLVIIIFILVRDHKRLLVFSKKERKELKKITSEIQKKRDEKKAISLSSYLLQADIFEKTSIYTEIKHFEEQQNSIECPVLTYDKQDQLNEELGRIFKDFQFALREINAKLTDNDIKLCCLSLLPLSNYGKAVCFGSTETSIIKQRKHYIKKKMTQDSDELLLFNFIFNSR